MTDNPVPANPTRLELEALTALQPGFARLMPEIGARMWKAYHAGRSQNWELAAWQLREMRKLFLLGTVTRPKYEANVRAYIDEDLGPLLAACEAADTAAFEAAFKEAVDAANDYHRRWNKGFLVWKVPQTPPEDLVLEPQG
ncbi:MAG: hypothetical protein M3R48_10380 [Candidatus Dormibacteraeota bacterium]|nr:hypothetical protein [Candidatus Dormibacteraeota bacterium]